MGHTRRYIPSVHYNLPSSDGEFSSSGSSDDEDSEPVEWRGKKSVGEEGKEGKDMGHTRRYIRSVHYNLPSSDGEFSSSGSYDEEVAPWRLVPDALLKKLEILKFLKPRRADRTVV